ncbi:enoyl-CoA hydratase-related protein [Parvularcula sp. LCG005]|uniref:enoyl-CoA hydratase-related protein n=1 Tax=Parvularcula sp. LCG005 TaxID=3078805 RepID=UPI002943E8A9|nr:enoyl-CoA hydratase-related protein [Parvularcula sp. LCG005]WOI54132.1 enoyl-CoA hydratase-related protein [Parvularcula sp. LCG005]
MNASPILDQSEDAGIVTVTMNRPDVHNALDEALIAELTQTIVSLARRTDVRAVILTGNGPSFSAGTDISWMERLAAGKSADDARRLANLLFQIRSCPKPTIAKINGAALGAGIGLAVACDILVADDEAQFAFPAVRLGMVPAVIGPFVTEAIGVHQARRYFLTGESFSAEDARRIGLVHAICLGAHLDETVGGFVEQLLAAGPQSLRETKSLINAFGEAPVGQAILDEAAKASARIRRTDEAREGLSAFIEKRPASWQQSR